MRRSDAKRREAEEIHDIENDPDGEQRACRDEHHKVDLYLQLGIEISQAHDAFQIDLPDAGSRERQRHPEHAGDLKPECPVTQALPALGAVACQIWAGITDHRQYDHHVRAVKGRMAVHGGNQRTVCPFIDRRPGVRQAQQTGAEKREHSTANRPVHSQRIGMRGPGTANPPQSAINACRRRPDTLLTMGLP